MPLFSGRSPHSIVRPEQIEVGPDRGQGSRQAGRRGRAHARRVPRLRDVPRRARRQPAPRDPLRGAAGNRQDLPREGDGQAGGRAVPVHLGARVPVDVVRHDELEDPLVLQALRKAARKEGGAIGFIEEIDAIGGDRGGIARGLAGSRPASRARRRTFMGPGGSRDGERAADPDAVVRPAAVRRRGCKARVDRVGEPLPPARAADRRRRSPTYSNILLIAATNRADDLDPALLRPGRFDRRLYFDLPTEVRAGASSSTSSSTGRRTTRSSTRTRRASSWRTRRSATRR